MFRSRLSRVAIAAMLSLVIWAGALFSFGCGAPSKNTITKLHSAAVIVVQQIDVNITLPDQLLAEKIITADQLATVRKYINEARSGAVKAEQFLAQAMTLEKPSLKTLAPIIADVILQLRGLTTFVNNEKVQKFFASVEFGLRVLGSYFALQVSMIRSTLRDLQNVALVFGDSGAVTVDGAALSIDDASRLRELLASHSPTDEDVCRAVGLKYEKAAFDALAYSYDGNRFDEFAAVLP